MFFETTICKGTVLQSLVGILISLFYGHSEIAIEGL